ncbi:bifunctional 2-polyprenyl-6-hydroxyphenol methylase/3-demethylubiquinol 3-O-methyltransferase UbiG [Chroococcidiopsis sp. TS-821]|uniref:bifunctional 2-polyprenyl-6-hydroxyphenol methylase/3-demethylubiquinol 3-O-methyltransferase UbiG n=1 Tax=Chroococcidiopsis sp. TS-821 TaxID=1378066 RepID=UPI000CEE55F3|nr:bifunctional 2-polyprenyl-6-hydroxyphenol methylase/3-demethylubiquinol 3-O-methyltransferase UbiG [Chroococcidiopsis sp. TS-821]PPS42258.1 3-demethylubiquinone-9 3-O-methyltransferase [Chroococcidiopsis sp. TS-821]
MKKNDLEFYDINADNWWDENTKIYSLYHLNKPRFEFFNRYVPNWQGLKALDVGCGGGFSCEFMAAMGVDVCGIDQSQKCIEAAAKHANNSGFEIDYCYGMAENMPYQDNYFDVVVCVDVLEHVESVPCVISEIFRVLKPNGLFFFDTINRNLKSKIVMIWLMENILGEIQRGVHDWNKFIKPEELTEILEKGGFKNIAIKGFDIFGEALRFNFVKYVHYKKTNKFSVDINDDTSINYIGKASKVV